MKITINKGIVVDRHSRFIELFNKLVNTRVHIHFYTKDEDFFHVEIEENDIFYHGTSQKIGEYIDKYGEICSAKFTGTVPIWETELGYNKFYYNDRIFMTKDYTMALMYAKGAARRGESIPVIYGIRGKDILDLGCEVVVDVVLDKIPFQSIVLKCECVPIYNVIRNIDQYIVVAPLPGSPYPDDLLDAIIEGTDLPKRDNEIFVPHIDNYTWDYHDISPEIWNKILPIIKERIDKLYNAGIIKYGHDKPSLYHIDTQMIFHDPYQDKVDV
jgi:hypothetical protein